MEGQEDLFVNCNARSAIQCLSPGGRLCECDGLAGHDRPHRCRFCQLSFSAPASADAATNRGLDALRRTASTGKHAEEIKVLVPVAQAVSRQFPEATITELRQEAVKRGLLTGKEQGKELSYLGAVMKAAGLVNSGRTRRSHLGVTHGIRQVIWLRPDGGGSQ